MNVLWIGCFGCPPNSVSNENTSNCICTEGYYSIPFENNLHLLQELDPDSYSLYYSTHISNSVYEWDANEYLGFWCALCPEGADCTTKGITLDTVLPLPGYFTGIDETGTVFFTCFNSEACLDDGACQHGYTGL